MRLPRMLFGLPLASLFLVAALTFLSPPPSADLVIAAGGISYQAPEFALANAVLPADPVLTAEAAIDKPRDAPPPSLRHRQPPTCSLAHRRRHDPLPHRPAHCGLKPTPASAGVFQKAAVGDCLLEDPRQTLES